MPRHPSARIIRNSVSFFRALAQQDPDGAPAYSQIATRTLQCSIQPEAIEVVDDQGRVTISTMYEIVFAENPGLNPRDKLVWNDIDNGITHTAYCHATRNEAGRGMAWYVTAGERQ